MRKTDDGDGAPALTEAGKPCTGAATYPQTSVNAKPVDTEWEREREGEEVKGSSSLGRCPQKVLRAARHSWQSCPVPTPAVLVSALPQHHQQTGAGRWEAKGALRAQGKGWRGGTGNVEDHRLPAGAGRCPVRSGRPPGRPWGGPSRMSRAGRGQGRRPEPPLAGASPHMLRVLRAAQQVSVAEKPGADALRLGASPATAARPYRAVAEREPNDAGHAPGGKRGKRRAKRPAIWDRCQRDGHLGGQSRSKSAVAGQRAAAGSNAHPPIRRHRQPLAWGRGRGRRDRVAAVDEPEHAE